MHLLTAIVLLVLILIVLILIVLMRNFRSKTDRMNKKIKKLKSELSTEKDRYNKLDDTYHAATETFFMLTIAIKNQMEVHIWAIRDAQRQLNDYSICNQSVGIEQKIINRKYKIGIHNRMLKELINICKDRKIDVSIKKQTVQLRNEDDKRC